MRNEAGETLRIAATIPAYQAAPSVGEVVRGTLRFVPEVLVMDDGSTDATAEEARRAGARVLSLPCNRGKGAALAGGLRRPVRPRLRRRDHSRRRRPAPAGGDPQAARAAAEQGGDLVLGIRDHLFGNMSGMRRASNRLSSKAISFAAGQRLSDIQTGFRLYSRRLVETVGFPGARFEAESAVVVRAARRGFKVVTVPVRLGFADGRTTSHYRPLLDSLRIAGAVTRARLEMLGWARSS